MKGNFELENCVVLLITFMKIKIRFPSLQYESLPKKWTTNQKLTNYESSDFTEILVSPLSQEIKHILKTKGIKMKKKKW